MIQRLISTGLWLSLTVVLICETTIAASAASFEDRWSMVPKANDEASLYHPQVDTPQPPDQSGIADYQLRLEPEQ